MSETVKAMWRGFYDWVMGNGPRPENEIIPPDPPPDLPFARKPVFRAPRFHELTIRERYDYWLEHRGLRFFSSLYTGLSVLTCLVLVGLLLFTVSQLPPFGNPENPANSNEVVRRYTERGGAETGARNIVAGVILDYRAFDTFGESAVLFTAAVSVLMLLKETKRGGNAGAELPSPDSFGRTVLQRGPPFASLPGADDGDDAILRSVACVSIPVILMLGCVIIINGHISPGGGFAGGAILSTALMLCASAFGAGRVRSFFSERVFTATVSSSLLAYAALKGYSFFTGANGIESGIPTGTIGNILSAGLILPLNIFVGIIVAGTLYAFYALFSEGEI